MTYKGDTLTEGVDYTVEYADNIDAGTATLWIYGKGKYTGKVTLSFEILPFSIKNMTSIGFSGSCTYTGKPCIPRIGISVDDKYLYEDKDYTLTYENNVNAGQATITIIGKGNYSDTDITYFTIAPARISETVVGDIQAQSYTGGAITPAIELRDGDMLLNLDKDYTVTYSGNINVGEATVTITGIGNYAGIKTETFLISPRDIRNVSVSIIGGPFTYTGEPIDPLVVVKDGERTLIEDADYTVGYSKNINAGTGYVEVTGKGNYSPEYKNSSGFTIEKQPVALEIKLKNEYADKLTKVYDKTRNTTCLTDDKLPLAASWFEFVSTPEVENDIWISSLVGAFDTADVGEKTVTVEFKISQNWQNYTYSIKGADENGKCVLTFPGTITPKQITIRPGVEKSATDTTLVPQSKVYGTANPSIYSGKVDDIVSGDSLGAALTGALEREPGENVGRYRITQGTLEGIGNYATDIILEKGWFEITPKAINSTDVNMVTIENQNYTGESVEPEITLTYTRMVDDRKETATLEQGIDFTAEYTNNVEPGTAKVTITGIGNYTDIRTATFRILKVVDGSSTGGTTSGTTTSFGSIGISAISDQTYTGAAIEPSLTVVATRLVDDEVETAFLVKGVDYDVVYSDNVQPGTATAYIVGKGDYSFGKTVTFRIVAPAAPAAPVVAAPVPAADPVATVPTVPAVKKSGKATVSAAPGAVYQLDLGGATGKAFKSSNKKVATVDGNGVVTVKKAGKVKISFKVGKKKRTVTLTVKDPTIPAAIALNLSGTVPAKVGVPQALSVTLPAGTSSGIKWKSSNKKVATVKNGVVTFKKSGKVTVTATATRGKKKAKVKFVVSK